MSIEEIVYKHWDEMFDEILKEVGDSMWEILIEIKTDDGHSVRKSWRDRDKRLSET